MQNIIVDSASLTQHRLVSFQFQGTDKRNLIHVESTVQSLLGWSESIILAEHRQWLDLVHPKHHHALLAQLGLLTDGQSIQCDYLIQNQRGIYQWVRSQFINLQSQNIVCGTWLDLSHSQQLEVQELRYIKLLENIIEATHSLFYPAELELGMSQVLARIGTVTEVDRVYFLGLEIFPESAPHDRRIHRQQVPSTLFAWGRQGSYDHSPGHWLKRSFHNLDRHPIWQHLRQDQPLNGTAEQLPAEISACLLENDVHSILLLPIFQNNRFAGVLGLENSPHPWTAREIHILEQLNMTLGVALKQFHLESRLSHHAFHDPLTELPNRALLLNRLEQCLRRKARQNDYSFAVLFLDLDRFKPVNDRLGHDVGDRLLIQVAQRISNFVRPGDTVARLGGDEFVILLDHISNASQAESAIIRLREELTRCFQINSHDIYIDASVGIALSSMEYQSAEEILQKADLAMYRAKNAGKGCYRIFETSMHSQMMQQSDIEFGMRLALQRQEFEVHYQPILSLDARKIQGFEALARWNHPQLGLLDPNHFISVAEETGMIQPLGMQILRMACQQTKEWQDTLCGYDNLTINVNLSPKQLVEKDLISNITHILEETNLSPASLHLELTESFMIRNDADTHAIIERLQSLGIKIYLDDFGAGYSSLQYLNFFPINGLKIDRMFTQKIPSNSETQAIVRSIIIMAQALKMNIVVEGIENQTQIGYLNQFADISGQGYLFARPLSSGHAQAMLMG